MNRYLHMGGLLLLVAVACSSEPTSGERAKVVAVVDGDTFKVNLATGEVATVRLLGVDAPDFGGERDLSDCNESAKADYCQRWRKVWEKYHGTPTLDIPLIRGCYDEGLAVLRNLLEGRNVTLIEDDTVGSDPYGRLLRYMEDEQGDDVSRMLVETGRAIVFGPCKRCDELSKIEGSRALAHEGCLWAE